MPSKYRYKNTVVKYPTGRVYTRDILRGGKVVHKQGSPIVMYLAYGSGSKKDPIMNKPKIVSYETAVDLCNNKGYDLVEEKKKMKDYSVRGEYLGIVDGRRAYNKIIGEADIFEEAVHKMKKPQPAVIASSQVRYLAKSQGMSPMEANDIIRDMDKLGLVELQYEDAKLRRKAEKQAEKEEVAREAAERRKRAEVTTANLMKKTPPKKKKAVKKTTFVEDEEGIVYTAPKKKKAVKKKPEPSILAKTRAVKSKPDKDTYVTSSGKKVKPKKPKKPKIVEL